MLKNVCQRDSSALHRGRIFQSSAFYESAVVKFVTAWKPGSLLTKEVAHLNSKSPGSPFPIDIHVYHWPWPLTSLQLLLHCRLSCLFGLSLMRCLRFAFLLCVSMKEANQTSPWRTVSYSLCKATLVGFNQLWLTSICNFLFNFKKSPCSRGLTAQLSEPIINLFYHCLAVAYLLVSVWTQTEILNDRVCVQIYVVDFTLAFIFLIISHLQEYFPLWIHYPFLNL